MARIFLIVINILLSTAGICSELANPLPRNLTSDAFDNQSRAASAQALEGIIEVFRGLQAWELQQYPRSEEAFRAASRALFVAADRLRSLEIPERYRNVPVPLPGADIEFINRVYRTENQRIIDVAFLFSTFTAETTNIATLISRIGSTPPSNSVLTIVSVRLNNYIRLGEVITRGGNNLNR